MFIDVSDGSVGIFLTNLTIEFVAQNRLPYFSPALSPFLSVQKTPTAAPWSYQLPPFFDADIMDRPSLTINLNSASSFMQIVNGTKI